MREYWINENLKALAIPEEARAWLLSLWNACQVFDDMADGEFPDRDKLDAALCDCLVNMPANEFFQIHREALLPLVANQILKWKGSDTAERAGEADAVSFVWRAGYYDIVLAVVALCHGHDIAMGVAHQVMQLYGEDFPAYCEEFDNA